MSHPTTAGKQDTVSQTAARAQSAPPVPDGFERCFYTLWGREEDRIWELVPSEDLVGSIVEGTGRQDWRKVRPFDLLPDLDPLQGGIIRRPLYAGSHLRIACARIAGAQPLFERAGDYETILFQFSGLARVETSFGSYELSPGEALYIPAMVAHRTIGSASCRRMEYYPRDPIEVKLDPEQTVTDTRFTVTRAGEAAVDEQIPASVRPPSGKIRERLTRWEDRPEDAYLFERSYDWMVGRAESGPRPVKLRPFDYFTTPPDSPAKGPGAVRTALLWAGPTFAQRVYANPGRQPAPHRGYDEEEQWFQFNGCVAQETEHGAYAIEAGESSMAEAGISHTSTSHPGSLRVTTYTNQRLRLVVDPSEHQRTSRWEVQEQILRGHNHR